MSSIVIHSIRPCSDHGAHHGWRIASASVPIGIAELDVEYEEAQQLLPVHVLLLETMRSLESDGGPAKLASVAECCGIIDEALMASILVPLAERGLVLIDGECVRQNPAVVLQGVEARVIVEREEQVCVIGDPPVPIHGVDLQRLRTLRAFQGDARRSEVTNETLESWRTEFWDEHTRRLKLREYPRSRLYVLEEKATGDGGLHVRDEQNEIHLELPSEHPFIEQLHWSVGPILQAAPALLQEFGEWDAESSVLRCTGEQWTRWRAARGRELSEVILRSGDTHIAVQVRCHPADGEAARAMLLENVIEELDSSAAPFMVEDIAKSAANQRGGDLLSAYDLATPTLDEIEAGAWDSGRWELAYRIARAADGL